MFGFLCSRQLLPLKHRRTHLGFLQQNGFFLVKSFTSVGSLPESNQKPEEEEKLSLAVSYLINSCGLSKKSAILASQRNRVLFQSPERPDSVLNLFKENGFSNAQISKIVRKHPRILLSHPEKILLPKIELLRSIGFSIPDLITSISSYPFLFIET
jgi:mTERF domain-containing protein